MAVCPAPTTGAALPGPYLCPLGIDGGQWPEVDIFVKSGLMEQTVTRPVGRDTRRPARALGVELLPNQATFRLVRTYLPNGNGQILAHLAQQHLTDEKAARYQPNLTYAIARLRLRLFGWLIKWATPDDVLSILTLIGKTLERKRLGRYKRRPKSRPNPRPRRQYK
jgi:hypothetical protein